MGFCFKKIKRSGRVFWYSVSTRGWLLSFGSRTELKFITKGEGEKGIVEGSTHQGAARQCGERWRTTNKWLIGDLISKLCSLFSSPISEIKCSFQLSSLASCRFRCADLQRSPPQFLVSVFSCLWRWWYFPFPSRWHRWSSLVTCITNWAFLFSPLFILLFIGRMLTRRLQVECKWHNLRRPLGTSSCERATTLMGPLLHTPPAEASPFDSWQLRASTEVSVTLARCWVFCLHL